VKNDPIETALARLDDPQADIAKSLSSKWSLVAAKAARMAGDRGLSDLTEPVAAAFLRLLKSPAAADKGCVAKLAMARALHKLDYDGAELFLAGMKHFQPEPVWGGSEDTAAELRAVCAMGLAGSRYHLKLRELVGLMADKEWPARAGAIRALAAVGSDSAALLLRFKAFTGDREAEVMADCFTALLAVEGHEAVTLVLSFAPKNEEAILALGASRLTAAIEALAELFSRTADPETRRCILLALATSRTEPAIGFLLELIREGSAQTAVLAVKSMAIHRADAKLRAEVSRAVEARTDTAAEAAFAEGFAS
jgi:hypothetical protein